MSLRAWAATQRRARVNLWRVGAWTASPRGVNGLGSVLAFLGCLAVALGLASAVLASTFYAHRAEVSQARAPVAALDAPQSASPALRWSTLPGAVGDSHVGVYALEPLRAGAPLPPGADRWPAPGEALLSPALRDLLAASGVPDRFGRPAGVIDREGLAAQTELLAYVRLASRMPADAALPLAGFGVDSAELAQPVGEVLYDRSVLEFWSLAGLLLVLPGVVALLASARVADGDTRRRQLLLVRLGASRRQRAFVALPRVLPPVAASLVVSSALVLLVASTDVTIPFKGNVLDAAVVRPVVPWLLGLVLGTHVTGAVALALVMASSQGSHRGERGAGRLVPPQDRPAWGRTFVLLAVLAAQPWIVARVDNETSRYVSTVLAAGAAAVCLPAALATVLRLVSAWRSRRDLEAGRVGAFLGWRVTGHRSRAAARLVGSVCTLVIVVGHAAAVLALFSGPALEASRTARRIGTSMLVAAAGPLDVPSGEVARFAYQRGLAAVEVRRDLEAMTTTLTGTCEDLRALGADCRGGPVVRSVSGHLDELAHWYGTGGGTVGIAVGEPGAAAAPPEGDSAIVEVVFISRSGRDLDALSLARDSHLEGTVLRIEPLGASWVRGAIHQLNQSYWLFVFGIPGVLTLLVVSALTWAAVVIEESKELVRSPLLAERTDVYGAVAAVRVAVPVALGALAGVAATAWLLAPHARVGTARMPTAFLSSVTVATVLVGVVAWRCASRLMAAASRARWGA